jgi:ubiquinone/menaquinone biosynthesis C-methylase UbiE
MSASEKQMAQMMGYKYRKQFLQKVVELIPETASSILDIGCGVGLIRSLILERIPSASIIGMDISWYMLTHQLSSSDLSKRTLVQGRAPEIPFKKGVVDAVIAVQFLSEVFCFCGEEGFIQTIRNIKRLLRKDGVLAVLDHQNPGEQLVELRFTKELVSELKKFQQIFQVRTIEYKTLSDGWIRMTLRDLYDFLTKTWALGTDLEEEEMQESHTPFSGTELASILEKERFSTRSIDGVIDFETYLKRNKIVMRTEVDLPSRFLLVSSSL